MPIQIADQPAPSSAPIRLHYRQGQRDLSIKWPADQAQACLALIQPEQIFLLVTPVDMHWSIERLSLLVQQTLGSSPCDGTAYGFTNRSYSRLKLLIWDGNGVWLCQRRLHTGRH
ncbi:IS66 family insertion sequence element accessory protein TnpB [Deefgea piscis]|uniref:IS66 family insertion sequence element accessory protein TnpB n=1 Tax=Deefgea piscis TaxID=2739061 RepID=UPI001C2D6C82|nr:IS66 family insertion sequence element accessory protein TnpB [Deefgea piscis]